MCRYLSAPSVKCAIDIADFASPLPDWHGGFHQPQASTFDLKEKPYPVGVTPPEEEGDLEDYGNHYFNPDTNEVIMKEPTCPTK